MAECDEGIGMVFEFERQAMNNEPLPEGLSMEDQMLYLSLRSLYTLHRTGAISREQGAVEKGKLIYECKKRKRMDNVARRRAKHTAAMWASISGHTAAYRKERTPENADKLLQAIEGHVHKWEGFESDKD